MTVPGDGASPAGPDVPTESGSDSADEPVAAGDEPTVVSLPAGRDDELTTLLTPPPAPAEVAESPAEEPTRPAAEPRSVDGGETMRLQPPFFAPDTTRTRRPEPATDSPDVRNDTPAGPPAGAAPPDRADEPQRGLTPLDRGAEPSAGLASPDRDARSQVGQTPFDRGAEPSAGLVSSDREARSQAGQTPFDRGADPSAGLASPDLDAWSQVGQTPFDRAGADQDRWANSTADSERRQDRDVAGPASAARERPGAREPVTDSGESRSGAPVVSPDAVTATGAASTSDGTSGGAADAAVAVPEKAVPEKPAARRRLSSAGALIWVLLALLGFTMVVQLRSNDDDGGLASARQEDLVGILSDLEARDQRLQQEINALEESQRQLTSGVAGRQAALAEANKRADELGLLSGTLPARGPGLEITIDPKGQPIKASALLNAVQELRGAGGEVMEIIGDNGVAVRIVASSYFVDAAGGQVIVDGKELSGPYTLWVIGVPSTMQTALQIPGGVVASVSQAGGNVTMEQRSTVEVTAVRQPTSLQYARPVS